MTAESSHRADSDAEKPRPSTLCPPGPRGRLAGDSARNALAGLGPQFDRQARAGRVLHTTLRKQERLSGRARPPEQTLAMKVRNRPFAIYLKFLAPKAGKEVVYAEGHHENKVIAHNGDWTRKIIPRLAVAPSSLHRRPGRPAPPVTEAGLLHLAGVNSAQVPGSWTWAATTPRPLSTGPPTSRARPGSARSTHGVADGSRPFARVEVLYDPETQFLRCGISSYDWPAPGHAGDLELAEHYAYDDLKLDAPSPPTDLDPANPDFRLHTF